MFPYSMKLGRWHLDTCLISEGHLQLSPSCLWNALLRHLYITNNAIFSVLSKQCYLLKHLVHDICCFFCSFFHLPFIVCLFWRNGYVFSIGIYEKVFNKESFNCLSDTDTSIISTWPSDLWLMKGYTLETFKCSVPTWPGNDIGKLGTLWAMLWVLGKSLW